MMRERFEKPEMEKIAFEAEDIIVTSGQCGICDLDCDDICKNDRLH